MATWMGLFRGLNVGGNNVLRMTNLKRDLESLKFKNVRTYIQSGNVVFDSPAKTASSLQKKIVRRIEEQHGFRPQLLILSPRDLATAIESNPYPEAVSDPKTLHFYFLTEPANKPNREALNNIKSSTESYHLTDRIFYLHAPDGIGRSKLAANVEKHLGVSATARNYNTVKQLQSMVANTAP